MKLLAVQMMSKLKGCLLSTIAINTKAVVPLLKMLLRLFTLSGRIRLIFDPAIEPEMTRL